MVLLNSVFSSVLTGLGCKIQQPNTSVTQFQEKAVFHAHLLIQVQLRVLKLQTLTIQSNLVNADSQVAK